MAKDGPPGPSLPALPAPVQATAGLGVPVAGVAGLAAPRDPTVVWQERPPISLSNMSYVYVDGERKPLNTLGIQWKVRS